MPIKPKSMPYQSYLLRLWAEVSAGQLIWRVSLECIQDGEQVLFPTLEELHDFLEGKTVQPKEDMWAADNSSTHSESTSELTSEPTRSN